MKRSIKRQVWKIIERDGHTLRLPVGGDSDETFPLTYVRTGPAGSATADIGSGDAVSGRNTPVVFIPGGPGLGSVWPYVKFRSAAATAGLDAVMVEHRGVGCSRRTDSGRDLPVGSVTVETVADDLAAVLDHAAIDRAVIYGSSYGTYIAQAFAVRHPGRVAALVLDSPMLDVEDDLQHVRDTMRSLLWRGDDPATADSARLIRELAAAGEPPSALTAVAQVTYEFAGPDTLHRLLGARRGGRLGFIWDQLARLGSGEIDGPPVPYVMEADLVSYIAYGQLGYGLPPDGEPLDPQLAFAGAASQNPAYEGQPLELPSHVPDYAFPVAVISGDRDLRTPRSIAHRICSLAPHAVLVPLADMGHSALDTHQLAALEVARAAATGAVADLNGRGHELTGYTRQGASRLVGTALRAAVGLTAGPIRE